MKKKLFAILIILMTISLCGCDDTWEDEPAETEIAEDEIKETAGDGKENDKTIDAEPVSVDSDARSATIMVYMNGSDLETQAGEATTDIAEMIDSGIGENVNVIIQTMGTKRWHDYDISSQTSQIYRVNKGELELIEDDLGQLDCTDSDTLSDFLGYALFVAKYKYTKLQDQNGQCCMSKKDKVASLTPE